MGKKIIAVGAAVALLAGVGAAAYGATPEHVAWNPDTMGNVGLSIDRVAYELNESPRIRQVVADTSRELLDAATEYGTTFEFERDILVCEQVYAPLESPDSDTYWEDPTTLALSECVNASIASHDMMEAGE